MTELDAFPETARRDPEPFQLAPPPVEALPSHGTFQLTVEGEPVPKLQGSILKFGKHMSIKKNPKTRRYEEIVREQATRVWAGRALIAGVPITMSIRFYRPIPKSIRQKDLARIATGELRPITKPDNTNLLKAFEDGLNGVVFVDDALIVTHHMEKHYGARPRVEVVLTW